MNPKKLVDFIEKETKVKPKKIQDVKIFDNFSFINVPFREAEIILDVFKRKKQKGKSIVQKAKEEN
jgi:ATP-dependent RNA helicase DeaD